MQHCEIQAIVLFFKIIFKIAVRFQSSIIQAEFSLAEGALAMRRIDLRVPADTRAEPA